MTLPRSLLVFVGILATAATGRVVLGICFRPAAALAQSAPTTSRVSVSGTGGQASGDSDFPILSADGVIVAFASSAANLVPGDSNGAGDVFVKNCSTGAIVCVSLSSSGTPVDGESYAPSISGDGQRVVFVSNGATLVPSDGNQVADVFLRDLGPQTTTRVSVSPTGAEADGASSAPRISMDGLFVSFSSLATNLVSGDTNGQSDVFVRNLQAGTVECVSRGTGGTPANGQSEGAVISPDGRYVVFASTATNLIPGEDAASTTQVWDLYRRDRSNGAIVRVSSSVAGLKSNGYSYASAVSADGRYVSFTSLATNLVASDVNGQSDVFVRDVQAGTTMRVSVGLGGSDSAGESLRPSMSGDGRYVTFESSAGNLVSDPSPEGSTWIYLRDLQTGTTLRVISASGEDTGDGGTFHATISLDGRWIAFSSAEPALVAGDSNGLVDVFVRGPLH